MAVSPADPEFLLLPIDVGGLYRSLDGGKHWNVAMVGWDARGAHTFAIDPRNAGHAIGLGSNSMYWNNDWGPSPNGVYLTTNKAASWKHVLAGNDGYGGGLAWDPSSYDPAKKICLRAYYLREGKGMFRSDDGGETWSLACGSFVQLPGREWFDGGNVPSLLQVDAHGVVFAGGKEGVFRSDDHGTTFKLIRAGTVLGLALNNGGDIYASGADGVFVSRDGGKSFTRLECIGLVKTEKETIDGLAISPVDPRRMLCWVARHGSPTNPDFQYPRYVTFDGGSHWQTAKVDYRYTGVHPQGREGFATWSPKDANVAWNIGGDFVIKSTDGGRSFSWSNNGYNGVMTGGLFNFNVRDPKTVFLGFQDYNGAFTTDGGKTWSCPGISGLGWGGHNYGGFALNRDVMWAGNADGWFSPRLLRITRDGGNTWHFVNGSDGKPLVMKGADVSFGDPADARIGFAANLRTTDAGMTWNAMTGCDGVFTADPRTRALYGRNGSAVVTSVDHGATWTHVADVDGGFVDLAIDHLTGRIYVASQDHLKVWLKGAWTTIETPADQFGNQRVWTLAVDPKDPAVIYVGGARNTYASAATVCRSTDGGKTWVNLTATSALRDGESGGPHEVSAIRVHPITREAWVAGQCYGLWRIAPPGPKDRGVSAVDASAPKAVRPPSENDLKLPSPRSQ